MKKQFKTLLDKTEQQALKSKIAEMQNAVKSVNMVAERCRRLVEELTQDIGYANHLIQNSELEDAYKILDSSNIKSRLKQAQNLTKAVK